MTFEISTVQELDKVVKALLIFANGRKKMVFIGEIGAGKTTLIKAFCHHFKVEDPVTSPTFSLVNEYYYPQPETRQPGVIYHLDLYRLKNLEEAQDIGIEEYLDHDDYCLIEWPEIIAPLLPNDVVRIKIEIKADSSRKILFL